MLPNVTIVKGQGGLGRTLAGTDHYSGIIFYAGTSFSDTLKPLGFRGSVATSCMQKITSLADAVALGVLSDFSDETKASAALEITHIGASGDTIHLTLPLWNGNVLDLGVYTSAGGLTVDTEATAIAAFINSGTSNHGCTAVVNGSDLAQVDVTVNKGLGIFPNTKSLTAVYNAGTALAVTVGAFSGGVASKLYQYWYQISEYFRIQPNGVLWVYFANVPSTLNFNEVYDLQVFAQGAIRKLGIFANGIAAITTVTQADLNSIGAKMNQCATANIPYWNVLYSCDIMATTTITNLVDTHTLTNDGLSTIIAMSLSGVAFDIYNQSGKSVNALGTALGTVSLALTGQSIAWVSQFNISDGTECEKIGYANGQDYYVVGTSAQGLLDGMKYIFLRKFDGIISGSYWSNDVCNTLSTSDYAFLSDNTVIQKAILYARTALIPQLNAPLTLNSDGTLQNTTIAYFEGLCRTQLEQMVRAGEISAYSVVVPANQNVLSTSTLVVNITIIKNGIARNITVNIGFGLSV